MAEIAPSSRFQVVNTPARNPGYCFLCRTTNAENAPFIDTGVDHEWRFEAPSSHDGVVYICSACVKEMNQTLNLSDSNVQQLLSIERQVGYQAGLEVGKAKFNEFASQFSDLAGYLDSGTDGSDAVPDKDAGEDESGERKSSDDAGSSSGPADKHGGRKRSASVPSDSASGELRESGDDLFS